MKKGIFKSIISLIMVLVLVVSMFSVSFVPAGAAQIDAATTSSFSKRVAERLLEQGVRAICELTLELGEHIGGEGEQKVESFAKWFLMDASEAAAYDAKQLCYEILDELIVLEEKIADYTTEISTQIENQNASAKLKDYSDTLTADVTNVMTNNGVLNAFDCYYKYFLITHLNETGLPEDESELSAINTIWHEITGNTANITTEDISDTACDDARKALDKSFLYIRSSTGNSEEAVYKSALTNEHFAKAINELSTNFVYTGLAYNDSQLSVVESAATYAYFALPYSHQQYEFVKSVADKQVLVAMILQMTYNEFLAKQGEYLEKYYQENPPESGTWNNQSALFNGSGYQSYDGLKLNAIDLLEYTGEEVAKLYDAKLDIETSSYVAGQDYDMDLNSYMKPDDAVSTTLSINGYASSVNYSQELKDNDSYHDIDNNSHISNQKYITSQNLEFYRVMSGSISKEVYYILSPEQFETDGVESNATAIGVVDHNVSRGETSLIDLYGNIHVASCDYLNLIKDISDGTNTYSCPSGSEISGKTGSLSNLFDTPAFAFSNYVPETYLSPYTPDKRSSDTYILTSTYYNNYDGGAAYPKYADIELVKAGSGIGNTKEVSKDTYNFENLKFNNGGANHSYILILENTGDNYLQTASVKTEDNGSSVLDFTITNDGNQLKNSEILSGESLSADTSTSAKVRPGNKITLKFKLNNDNTFVSLKCVKNNKEQSETILIDGTDELNVLEKNETGYYEFEYNMPYSNSTFVLETKEYESTLEKDDDGNFVIKTYDDLKSMAKKVNRDESEYVNGSYVLANDITCNEEWVEPIGISEVPFRGTFDGQGYTISGLTVTQAVDTTVGLFGALRAATIKNLNLENVDFDIFTDSYSEVFDGPDVQVGALCGEAYYDSTISNCTVSGSVKVEGALRVGGMCGYATGYSTDTVFEKCINNCTVSSDSEYIGGLIGDVNRDVKINNCANRGSVTADNSTFCGGLVGSSLSVSISNSYNTGEVSGTIVPLANTEHIGSICGDDVTVNNCYVLDNNQSIKTQGTVCTVEQFASGEVAYLLNSGVVDGTQVWYQNVDYKSPYDEYPHFDKMENNTVYKDDDVYTNFLPVPLEKDDDGNFIIKTYEDLKTMAKKVNRAESEYVNGSYVLANDIVCPDGEKWVDPIGENDDIYSTSSATFRGVFNGQGYTISNLHISNGETVHNYYGLFGQMYGATIKNLNLADVTMDCSGNYVGALVACMMGDNSLISNCTVSGKINVAEKYHVGGICGFATDSTIEKCINYCDIVSSADYVGGICGTNRGIITNCANFGSIQANDAQRFGGIAGGDISNNTITNCYNVGNVSGNAVMGMGSISGYASSYCKNNYYLDTTGTDDKGTPKTAEQFASGEVAYLLNSGVVDGTQVWYQDVDNIKYEADDYPSFENNGWNTVYKVDRENKVYSNQYYDYLLGDVNDDGSVDIIDATLIQKHLVKMYTIEGVQLLAADTDKDHTVSVSDATRIQIYLANIITKL